MRLRHSGPLSICSILFMRNGGIITLTKQEQNVEVESASTIVGVSAPELSALVGRGGSQLDEARKRFDDAVNKLHELFQGFDHIEARKRLPVFREEVVNV